MSGGGAQRRSPLVSVVTPVFNGGKYLRECIESVLAQTYQNWDYAIIDNCSTDGSLEIATRFAARDPRIHVVRNSRFLPAISNHNVALRSISPTSKYCKVVFGDDWIYPDCLAKMVAVAEAHPSIGLVSAYGLRGQEVMCTGLEPAEEVFDGHWICREHLLRGLHLFGSANTVLYRADLVRGKDPFFNEANIHADTQACFDVLKESDFGFVHEVLSFTRERPGSLDTVSKGRHSYFSGTLRILASSGSEYLTPAELAALQRRYLGEYHRFLGKSLLARRGEDFWAFHKTQLRELGLAWSWYRLLRGLVAAGLRALPRPRPGTVDARRPACTVGTRETRAASVNGWRREWTQGAERMEGQCR